MAGTRAGRAQGALAAAEFRLDMDEAALSRLFSSDDGPVAKDLARRAVQVDRRAKQHCPVDTGRLRASIAWRMARDASGLYAQVGTNVHYGIFIEFGTSRAPAQPFLRPAIAALGKGVTGGMLMVNEGEI